MDSNKTTKKQLKTVETWRTVEYNVFTVCLATAASHRYQLVVLPCPVKTLQHCHAVWKLVFRALLQLGEQLHADRQRTIVLVRKYIGQRRSWTETIQSTQLNPI